MRYTFLVPEFETRLRVRYAETDQMGVVYHANYLVWMEVARVEYCRSIGLDYAAMEEEGVAIAVVEVHCRYLRPARFDDEVAIRISPGESSAKLIRFNYEMKRTSDGSRLARGETVHLYVSRPDFRAIRLPQKYHAAFGVAGGERLTTVASFKN